MPSDTRDRILDATLAAMAAHGIARLSLEDVARRAGLSRQTVYRLFGNRDELLAATIVREERWFIARVEAAAGEHADVRPALEAAIAAALHAAREHPLLDRLLASEPERLLPLLASGASPVISAAQPALERLLAERLPHLSGVELRRAADAGTRLIVSYAINPPEDPIDEVAAVLADLLVHGLKD